MQELFIQPLELEKVINTVRGVISSKVIADEANTITEIHVLAHSNRSPKQIVRDIESSLMVKHGLNIDHKKISVVQTQEEGNQTKGPERAQLIGINLMTSGLDADADVELCIAGQVYNGKATGPNTALNRLRLISMATLNALEIYLQEKAKFVVEDIVKVNMGRKEIINVSIGVITNQGEDMLLGSAYVKNDDREAVGKATLNAVNRKVSLFS